MNKIIYIVIGVFFLLLVGGGIYYYVNNSGPDVVISDPVEDPDDLRPSIVRSDFYENFRDGEIDSFWKWDNKEMTGNEFVIDEVREEMTINADAQTSQWTNDDTAPTLSFLTDKDFDVIVEYIFDPSVDFQHAGIGLVDTNDNNWIRASRAYDSHALETDLDIADSMYVMEKTDADGVVKYIHQNFIDSRVFLRMTKEDDLVVFDYSRDGIDWQNIDQVQKENLSSETEVYLFVYSTERVPTKAVFRSIQFDVR